MTKEQPVGDNAAYIAEKKLERFVREQDFKNGFKAGQEAERLRILKEFNDFENADEIITSQGKHNLWTPADCAVYNICKRIVENKKEPEKEAKR